MASFKDTPFAPNLQEAHSLSLTFLKSQYSPGKSVSNDTCFKKSVTKIIAYSLSLRLVRESREDFRFRVLTGNARFDLRLFDQKKKEK